MYTKETGIEERLRSTNTTVASSEQGEQGKDPWTDLLYRQYLDRLDEGLPAPVDVVNKDLQTFLRKEVRLIHVERLIYEKKKEKLEELLNLYGALCGSGCALIFLIESAGKDIRLCVGVRADSNDADVTAAANVLESCFHGQFSGSQLQLLRNSDVQSLMESDNWKDVNGIATLTGIPSRKTDKAQEFVQGLDRFLDAMRGRSFTSIAIAELVPDSQVEQARQGYARLSTILSASSERQVQLQHSTSSSQSHAEMENFSKALAHTIGETQSTTTTLSNTKSRPSGWAYGLGGILGTAGFLIGGPLGVAAGAGVGAWMGGNNSKGTSSAEGTSSNQSSTSTETSTQGRTVTETQGSSVSKGETVTHRDRLLRHHIEQIDRHIERLQEGSRYGFWNTGIYFLSRTTEDAALAASVFQGLFRGEDSDLEQSRINVWSKDKCEQFHRIQQAIQRFHHPAIDARSLFGGKFVEETSLALLHPTSLLSSAELALVMGLPERSFPGLPVRTSASFGRQISSSNQQQNRVISMGSVYHLGREDALRLELSLESLTMHTLITGTTGSGKSNICRGLVRHLMEENIPCLVIEPCKGEYVALASLHTQKCPVHALGVGDPTKPLLQLNPFRFIKGIHVLEHIDRLGQLFCAAFPMYAAMPAILDEALHRVYEDCGWDLSSSMALAKEPLFPTMHDLVALLPRIIAESGYSEQLKSDYQGALVTRFRSLTRGIRGRTFCPLPSEETSETQLFEQTCIVDLKAVGSSETRALLMGMLLLRLYEYRQQQGMHRTLRHVTVLEEAHHLLRRTSIEQTQEHANPKGLAVEMFTNAIAEMRAFGEGFVIVDQSASTLDLGVIKNTNTKIILRTPFQTDRELVGQAANMNEDQIVELGRLETGIGAVYQNDWFEPVLAKFPLVEFKSAPQVRVPSLNSTQILQIFAIPHWCEKPMSREEKLLLVLGMPRENVLPLLGQKLGVQQADVLHKILLELYTSEETAPVYLNLLKFFQGTPAPLADIHAVFALLGFMTRRLGVTPKFAAHVLAEIGGWNPDNVWDRLAPYL